MWGENSVEAWVGADVKAKINECVQQPLASGMNGCCFFALLTSIHFSKQAEKDLLELIGG